MIKICKCGGKQAFEYSFALKTSVDPDSLNTGSMGIAIRRYFTPVFF